ncbi:MAG: VWA domain-containing protein, partial [Acidobacteriota bacterium]
TAKPYGMSHMYRDSKTDTTPPGRRPRSGRNLLMTAACAGLLTALAAGAGAQESESGGAEEPFFESVQTSLVNVDVYVTDRRGHPITDLGPADFELYEDDEPVEITNFFAVKNGRPVMERLETLPQGETRFIPQELEELPVDQRLHLIVYIDNFNLFPASRNRTLARLRNFLSGSMNRDDRVMVVSYDRSLHLRQPFTSDMGAVADALIELESLSGIASLREQERQQALEQISDANSDFQALSAARVYAESVMAEMTVGLRGMSRQLELLSGLNGRKALVYVSDGIPQKVGEDLFYYIDERFPRSRARIESSNYDLSHRYENLITQANSADVTLYSLDARGLQVNSSVRADFAGTREGGGLQFVDTYNNANLREPMHKLADDTGGQAVMGTNNIEGGLGEFLKDFRNYYSLGFQPAHFGSGRYYDLDVKVKREGAKVRYRQGYRDKTINARMADSTLSSLIYGAIGNPLGIDIGFGASRKDGNSSLVPVEVKIPLGKLTLVPQSGQYLGRVKVAVAVMDDEGSLSPVEQQPTHTIQIPEAEIDIAKTKSFVYEVVLAMRPGLSRVAVTVRDELTSQTSFLRETVKIGD